MRSLRLGCSEVAELQPNRVSFPGDAHFREDSEGCVRLAGRVEQVFASGVILADALSQVAVDFADEYPLSNGISPGDLLQVSGRLTLGRLLAQTIEVHVPCPESRGDGVWARFRWKHRGEALAQRARLVGATRGWFERRGFFEVATPTLLVAPGLDSGVDPIVADGGYLVTSPELHMKRLLVGGLPRIFQLAKCFRREELGPRHQPEFTMLEWYRAFSELDEVLYDTEELITTLSSHLGLGTHIEVLGHTVDLTRPFMRLSVAEAFERHAGISDVAELSRSSPSAYFDALVNRVEPALSGYDRPVFLTRYPASQAALARLCRDDPRFAERAELYLGGIEICNAYGELSSADEQRLRFEAELQSRQEQGLAEYPLDEEFLTALQEGMPPSAGNALGFDRLVAILLGKSSIEETMAFPRTAPSF